MTNVPSDPKISGIQSLRYSAFSDKYKTTSYQITPDYAAEIELKAFNADFNSPVKLFNGRYFIRIKGKPHLKITSAYVSWKVWKWNGKQGIRAELNNIIEDAQLNRENDPLECFRWVGPEEV